VIRFRLAPSLAAGLLLLVACAAGPDGSLEARTLPEEKRYAYLQRYGTGAAPEIRNAFMEGLASPGMPREWVLQLYGRPDRITDRTWEYLGGGKDLIVGIRFDKDVVDSVYGFR
jgi:hypothetical protein